MTHDMPRRQFLRQVGCQAFGGALVSNILAGERLCEAANEPASVILATGEKQPEKGDMKMAYTLPELPYGYNALEPYIDEQTVRIHHDKHHGTYVTKLNDALKGHEDLATRDIADLMPKLASLPADIRTAVRNNGAQHYNHSLYWQCMAPPAQAGGEPVGELALAIRSTFGDFAKFKEQLTKTAVACFGSGWGWLYLNKEGKLAICATSNEGNPLMAGLVENAGKPILVVDVWEHAYYIKYQNRRPDYAEAWWNLVNWKAAAERFAKAKT